MAKKRKAKSAQGKSTTTIAEVLKRTGSVVTFNPFDMLPKNPGSFASNADALAESMVVAKKPKRKPKTVYVKLPADQAKKVKRVSAKLTRKVAKELAAQKTDGPVRVVIHLDELKALLPKPKPRKKPRTKKPR